MKRTNSWKRCRGKVDRRQVLEAGLDLRRRELPRESLRAVTRRCPVATTRMMALIYAHSVGLRLAGTPVFAHPERTA
ncbi:MAG TPA: DUF1365 family protein [Solirubrobacteraceae bacterium]|nr:DUF1365 family protein [Solirubrobacteraceae bacterium]